MARTSFLVGYISSRRNSGIAKILRIEQEHAARRQPVAARTPASWAYDSSEPGTFQCMTKRMSELSTPRPNAVVATMTRFEPFAMKASCSAMRSFLVILPWYLLTGTLACLSSS